MIKILFLIHDLGQGGAEKVLVNLVNNLDRNKFDISVTVLFGGGVNEQLLNPDVHFHAVFPRMIPANTYWMKLLSPQQLHRMCVKDTYDIEISYLEGPSARIISGIESGKTKRICWIHSNHFSLREIAASFCSSKEAIDCYQKFDQIICVSQFMKDNFCQWFPLKDKCNVLYNTVDSNKVLSLANEPVDILHDEIPKLVAVGTLKQVKGFDRLLRIANKLKEAGMMFHLYLLGDGPLKRGLKAQIEADGLQKVVSMPGYQMNPYKYVSKCDLFVCSSYSEGFSTAATEALIVGTPVCTVDVSGMKEMLGEHDEYGVVTENTEEALYEGIKKLLDDPELLAHYKKQASERGKMFSKEKTVQAVEDMLEELHNS